MKILKFYLLIWLIGSVGCKTNKGLPNGFKIGEDFIPGKCYIAFHAEDGLLEESFVLQLQEPTFDTISRQLTMKELQSFNVGADKYNIRIQDAYTEFMFGDPNEIKKYTTDKESTGMMICRIEKPSHYKMYTASELSNSDNTVSFIKVVEKASVLKSNVRYKSKKLKRNQRYFEKAKWTKFKAADQWSH